MPFSEPGYDQLIKKVDLCATGDISRVADVENIIITVGTPLNGHIETDLSQVKRVVASLIPYLKKGQNIILRSTVAPNTTKFVRNYLEQRTPFKVGEDIFLSFSPERLVEGRAMLELHELPQVIGAEDEQSRFKAAIVFSKLTKELLFTDYISAELVKLFNNISRYVHFAMANQFTIIAESYKANIHEIIHMTNHKYPRGIIPSPGFTAGTCLRKDFGMINESIPYTDLLLSAWKVNEYLPKFLVEGLNKRMELLNRKVAVLGYTFKKDVDDVRDSLVPKLVRYIERETPREIRINEPNLGERIDDFYPNVSLEEALADADAVFLANNHGVYKEKMPEILSLVKKGAWIVDIWNISGLNGIFCQKKLNKK